jgi:tetrahydromethanopterin S-methyltransferase subunit F
MKDMDRDSEAAWGSCLGVIAGFVLAVLLCIIIDIIERYL